MNEVTFIDAIKPLIKEPVFIICVVLFVILAVYMLYIKKNKRFKEIVRNVIRDMILDAYNKGVRVEIIVDDIILKAVNKIKEKPDPWDGLLIYIITAKWFREKVISIIKGLVSEVAQIEPDSDVIVDDKPKDN